MDINADVICLEGVYMAGAGPEFAQVKTQQEAKHLKQRRKNMDNQKKKSDGCVQSQENSHRAKTSYRRETKLQQKLNVFLFEIIEQHLIYVGRLCF